jgi:hypothetical protein
MSHHTRMQIDATRALIKFITEHRGDVDADLSKCLNALENGAIERAVEYAKMVKPHGMGGLTDWFPPVVYQNESKEYVATVLHALVNHWCHIISISFPKEAKT